MMSGIFLKIYRREKWVHETRLAWVIIVDLGDIYMGINFSKYLKLPKVKSFRTFFYPGLDTKELVELLTRCLGKLGRFPRKNGASMCETVLRRQESMHKQIKLF